MRFMVIRESRQGNGSGGDAQRETGCGMGKYNEELVKAGVMLAGEGLQPSSKGAMRQFSGAASAP